MRLHLQKKAIRCFGVAESFRKDLLKSSILCGVVIRADLIVDGFVFGRATLGGNDVTSSIESMFKRLRRKDVNVVLIGGSIVSLFNIVDVDGLYDLLKIPVVSLTYRSSEGLEEHLRHHFPKEPSKIESYRKLGERFPIMLHTGKQVFIRCAGITNEDAQNVIEKFTIQGTIPEPIRVARLLSRAALNFLSTSNT